MSAATTHRFEFRFSVPGSHPALPGHFPGRPTVPGVLILDHVMTGVGAEMNRPLSVLQNVKFTAILWPDETATVACEANADKVRFFVYAMHADVQVTLVSGDLCLASRPNMAVNEDTPARGSHSG